MAMTNLLQQPSHNLLRTIRETRLKYHLTLGYMAHLLGYQNASSYANIEAGKRKLSFLNGVKILKILHLGFFKINVEQFTLTKVKQIRKQKKITLQQISQHLGYKYASSYTNIENGKRVLTYDNAVKIANFLGTDVVTLFFETKGTHSV